jgi:epsilon-lactone hydrolase
MSLRSKALEPILRVVGIKSQTASAQTAQRQLARFEIRPERFAPPRALARHSTIDWNGPWPSYSIYSTTRPTRLVYLHGGGYVTEIKPWHWLFAAGMAARLDARAEVPIYPLAARQTAAQTVPELADYISGVIETVGAQNVAVLGDSAGGGLALATAQHLVASGRNVPACLVLISPWLDTTMTDPTQYARRHRDKLMSIPGLISYAEHYAGDLTLDDPLVSPLFGSYSGLPPMQVITGTSDLFHVDALKFIEYAKEANREVNCVTGAGQQHIYPLMPFIPEARAARDLISDFLDSHLR